MTIDDRIDRLTANQERFDAGMRQLQESQAKTELILAGVLDSIKRLERIALAHQVSLDDVDATLARLEARRPQ